MVIKRPMLYKAFAHELQIKKAIYIFGPTGWGKTTAALDWLGSIKRRYTYLSVESIFDVWLIKTDKDGRPRTKKSFFYDHVLRFLDMFPVLQRILNLWL